MKIENSRKSYKKSERGRQHRKQWYIIVLLFNFLCELLFLKYFPMKINQNLNSSVKILEILLSSFSSNA